jgi:hypothetical protein
MRLPPVVRWAGPTVPNFPALLLKNCGIRRKVRILWVARMADEHSAPAARPMLALIVL